MNTSPSTKSGKKLLCKLKTLGPYLYVHPTNRQWVAQCTIHIDRPISMHGPKKTNTNTSHYYDSMIYDVIMIDHNSI